jgi:hypothetical protein
MVFVSTPVMRSVERMELTPDQKPENHLRFFKREIHAAERLFFRFLKSLAAGVTAEALIAFAVFADFDGLQLAVVTGHERPG